MTTSTATATPLSYSINRLAQDSGLSKNYLINAINTGQLKARRSSTDADGEPAGKYVVLHADAVAFLDSLPEA